MANDPKVYEPVVLDQTEENQLSAIADAERKKLITRNDFKKNADEYGVTNSQALAERHAHWKDLRRLPGLLSQCR
jgi:hypothetical protein